MGPSKSPRNRRLSTVARDPFEKVAVEAAAQAGQYLAKKFGHVADVRLKGRRDLVTEADLKAQEIIVRVIKDQFKDHSIYAEEELSIKGKSDYSWIVDPIDGTTNFACKIPHFAASIALLFKGQLFLGIVYDPIKHELFHAKKGKGSFMNGKPISVSKESNLEASIIAVGLGAERC